MASVEYLRVFVNERLTAAAEEIFRVFKKTVVEYEQEIDRQRKLLDIVCKPEIKLDSIELQQQHVCKENDALADQQLRNQERSSSLDQEEPEPPQIKEEEEELFTSQEGEQLVLKLETDTFIFTPFYEQRDQREPEPQSEQQLLSRDSHVAERQDQQGGKQGDSGSTRHAESKTKKNESHSNNVYNPNLSEINHNTQTGEKPFKCNTCGKDFECKSNLCAHMTIVTKLPQQHVCKEEEVLADQQLCSRERSSNLDQEEPEPSQIKEEEEELCTSQEGEQLVLKMETDTFMLTPTNEENDHSEPEPKPYHQLLSNSSHVAESQDQKGGNHGDSGSTRDAEPETKKRHHKSKHHSDNVYNPNMSEIYHDTPKSKKSYICDACGKVCRCKSKLNIHMRIHTGEKPYSCNTCGKRFNQTSGLKAHRRTHTGERPYSCNTCGKTFNQTSVLKAHIRIHTGEKPFSCKICGRAFRYSGDLTIHMRRAHTGEKPYNCNTCGKRFSGVFEFSRHMKVHKGKSSSD